MPNGTWNIMLLWRLRMQREQAVFLKIKFNGIHERSAVLLQTPINLDTAQEMHLDCC